VSAISIINKDFYQTNKQMSAYYCDILDGSDKRMDYDAEEQFKQDPLKQLSFKVKSAPNKGLNLSNGTDMVKGKEAGTWDFKSKSELKYSCAENQYQTKLVTSNKDYTMNIEANPRAMNNENVETTFETEFKCTPQKTDWEGKLAAKVGKVKLGPITSYSEVSFTIHSHLIFIHCIVRTQL
jgi:hypothetical protein